MEKLSMQVETEAEADPRFSLVLPMLPVFVQQVVNT
jgi:hypothetical protein